MQLKHINFTTSDVTGLAAFFEQFFGFKHFDTPRDAFAVMRNEEDFVVTLMKGKKDGQTDYPETFHIGFYFEHPDAVQAKHDELSAAGLAPGKIKLMERGGGERATYFYCAAPGNVVVEICTPPGGLDVRD
jgi:catechol 2,3-dioxygenase-like lactoylglutathione lyase family enzyme